MNLATGNSMPNTKRLMVKSGRRSTRTGSRRIANVDLDNQRGVDYFVDEVITAGIDRVRAEGDELRRRGLLDKRGNLLKQELPADMKEGSERDFGG